VRGHGEALFWIGTFHQVVRGDDTAALPSLRRAHALATHAGDELTLSYVVRHLAFADIAAGRTDSARAHLEESLRLRRKIDFTPGVAAAVLALAWFAAENGTRDEARNLLAEARSVAVTCGATGVVGWVDAAAAELGLEPEHVGDDAGQGDRPAGETAPRGQRVQPTPERPGPDDS